VQGRSAQYGHTGGEAAQKSRDTTKKISWVRTSKFQVQVILWPTVSRPVLVSGPHLGPMTRFLITVENLRSSCCGAPSLTRGRVCNLFVWLAVTVRSKPRRTQTISYWLIWYSPNLDPAFISPRNRVAKLYPWELGSLFIASYEGEGEVKLRPTVSRQVCLGAGPDFCFLSDNCGFLTWGAFSDERTSQSQSYLTTDGQSASLSWFQATIRAHDQFFFLLEIFFRRLQVCCFVAPSLMRGRVCNLLFLLVLTCAVQRDSRPYFIVQILETPPTWRARSQYLYPPGAGWPRYTPGYWV
jgi:hypothetical protein